jgi:hypothetical protein
MTPVPESGTRREPVEPSIRKAVFTNLMACFRCDNCAALNICSMWTGDVINPDLDAAGLPKYSRTRTQPFPQRRYGILREPAENDTRLYLRR